MSEYLRRAVSLHALGHSLPLTKTLHVMKTTQSHNTENNWYISPQEHVEGHKVCLTDVKIYIYTYIYIADVSDVFNSRAESNSSSGLLFGHQAKWAVPFVTYLWPVLIRERLAQLGGLQAFLKGCMDCLEPALVSFMVLQHYLSRLCTLRDVCPLLMLHTRAHQTYTPSGLYYENTILMGYGTAVALLWVLQTSKYDVLGLQGHHIDPEKTKAP